MKRIIGIIMIIGTFSISFAQEKNSESISEKEYILLKEQYEKLIDKQVEIEQQENEIIRELKEERANHQHFVECIYRWITVFVGAILGIFSFMGWKNMSNLVHQKCTELIADVVSGKKDIIESELRKYDRIAQYKSKKKILVVSNTNPNIDFANELKKLKFKNVMNATFEECFLEKGGNYTMKDLPKERDLIFINELFGDEAHNEKIIESVNGKPIFFFNGRIPQNKYFLNVGSATMPSQVYGNLLNLLEFTE